jgi:ZIP family zinc transporter
MVDILSVLIISIIAGLGTGLGGLIVVIRKPGPISAGFFMGLASGVMLTVSFVALVMETLDVAGIWTAVLGFGAGAVFIFVVDILLPHTRFGVCEKGIENRMLATGIMLAIGIAIHNLPEGIAVGAGYAYAPVFGLVVAIGIAIHNIPEGMATAIPLYLGSKSRRMTLKFSFLSGLVEPVGAVFAALFLTGFRDLIPFALAFAAGVMFFITLDELLPSAKCTGHEHATGIGVILGAVIMLTIIGIFNVV